MTIEISLKKTVDDSYPIELGPIGRIAHNNKVAVVTNPTVSALHLQALLSRIDAPEVSVVTVPDGEQHKTMQTLQMILEHLFEHRFDRKSLLVAFGGGVIGDMTGFAASIYQRGIGFVQVPTTLLSMVDASVGGKTGVNNRYGKNLIGSFHQPRAVHIDPAWLQTLPKREWSAGVAEMVKMAATLDRGFFEWLEQSDLRNPAQLQEAIAKSVQLKADVVAQDEKETGLRQVLNYGHTFGHVIERETRYETYLHGECVAMGMVMANNLAVELGLLSVADADRVRRVLARYELPLSYPVADPAAFYDAFFLDKKTSRGKITFVLPKGIGGYALVDDAPQASVLKAVKG
ncbi:MAG: 3-dehydroquinate synthase [Campylobacterales bacterium]